MERQDNTPQNPFKPTFRILDSTVPDAGWGPARVADRDIQQPNNRIDYRNPKCEAIVDVSNFIYEVAVCYQMRDMDDANADWDIGVTRMIWTGDQYLDFPCQPTNRIDEVLDDPYLEIPPLDDLNPDIAYDYMDGDLYVVYESVEDAAPTTQVHLKYRHFTRDGNDHTTGTWPANNQEWYAQTQDHNGHTPSIDIGLIDLDLVGYPGVVDINYALVAYTTDFADQTGFHVAVSGWLPESADGNKPTVRHLRNPAFMWLDAGLPCIDITPNTNTVNFAAVVFQQNTGADAYGPRMRVFEVDMTNDNLYTLIGNPNDHDDGLYPSIALHEQYEVGLDTYTQASITYMGQVAQGALMRAYAARLRIEHGPPWPHTVPWYDPVYDTPNITGNYNPAHVSILDPGVSTDIVALGANSSYWAAWCDRIEMEDPPETVWAAYGYAGQ